MAHVDKLSGKGDRDSQVGLPEPTRLTETALYIHLSLSRCLVWWYNKHVHIRRATEEDGKGNFEEAYKLYSTALEYFMTAIKCILPHRCFNTIPHRAPFLAF